MSQKVRLRRLRYNKTVRDLFEDTHLRPQDLIYPIFVCEGKNIKNEIKSMPGQYQVSVDRLPSLCNKLLELNIKSVILSFFVTPYNPACSSRSFLGLKKASKLTS